MNISRNNLFLKPDITVEEKTANEYIAAVKKRESHIPLQYITGVQEFLDYRFKVNEDVLIPRQETELLVDMVSKYIGKREMKVLDLCTGSGCIGISLDKICKKANVTAVDVSTKALEIARQNNIINGANVKLLHSDLFENIHEKFDVIVSNPPYIPTKDIECLEEEVKIHEPMLALDGDTDGLRFYELICKNAAFHLNDNGKIFFEIGYNQGMDVYNLLKNNGFKDIQISKDLSGRDRMVSAGKE
jgi:release factor glutamine methyltransferase